MTSRKNFRLIAIAVVDAVVVCIILNIILCCTHNFLVYATPLPSYILLINQHSLRRPVVVSQLTWYLAGNKAVGLQLLTYITAEEPRKSDDQATLVWRKEV